jgi:hypothetical protein
VTQAEESPQGPYIIHEVLPGGAYRLKDMTTGDIYASLWNIAQLRRFYS